MHPRVQVLVEYSPATGCPHNNTCANGGTLDPSTCYCSACPYPYHGRFCEHAVNVTDHVMPSDGRVYTRLQFGHQVSVADARKGFGGPLATLSLAVPTSRAENDFLAQVRGAVAV